MRSLWQGRGARWIGGVVGAVIAVGILASVLWQPDGVPVTVLIFFVLGLFTFGYLVWRLITGRDGLIHRGPTARRLRRLGRPEQ